MNKLLFCLALLLIQFHSLSAQCSGEEDGNTCQSAVIACNLGDPNTPVNNIDMCSANNFPGQPSPLCPNAGNSAANNISWISFTAGNTDITFTLNFQECTTVTDGNGNPVSGAQYGVYTSCAFDEVIACEGNATTGLVTITSDEYIIGNTYIIFVDGFAGSCCSVDFEIISGGEEYEVPDSDPVDNVFDGMTFDPPLSDDEICLGGVVNFNSTINFPPGENSPWYRWTIDPPTSTYPDGIVNPGNNSDAQFDIVFDEPGVFEICGFAYTCCDTSNIDCGTYTVIALPDDVLDDEIVCFEDLQNGIIPAGWQGPAITAEGDYSIMTEDPTYECDFIQRVSVEAYPIAPPENVFLLVCDDNNTQQTPICNTVASSPLNSTPIICEDSDVNGCDSTIFLTATFVFMQAQLLDPVCSGGNLEFQFIGGGWPLSDFETVTTYELYKDNFKIWEETTDNFDYISDFISVPLDGGDYYLQITVEKYGQECFYVSNIIDASGDGLFPPDPELDVWSLNPCVQDSVSYQLNGNNDPSNLYIWNVTPAAGLIIEDDSTTVIGINWAGADENLTYTICVEADNGCGLSAPICEDVDVIGQPLASYTLADTMCIVDITSLEYNGTNLNGGEYIWNFDGGDINGADPNGPGIFDLSYSTTGTKFVSLLVNQGSCISEIFVDSIVVIDPLSPPVISCGSAVDSIGFNWPDLADGYMVNVLDAPANAIFSQDGASFSVTGLNPLDSVEIEVIAIDNGFCPNVSTIIQCIAQNCLPVSIELPTVDTICLDASAMSLNLNAVVNPMSDIAVENWDGTGITDNTSGIFDPSVSLAGTHQIVYTYTVGDCPYTDAFNIVVLEQPISSFEIEDTICITDFVTVNYSGTFSNGIFEWDFDEGMNTGTGSAPFDISWTTPGLKTVSLNVSNGQCNSDIVTRQVLVQEELEAPVIICAEQTNDITFSWNSVNNATEYEVFINGASQGIQSGTSFFVDGLEPGDMVDISVVAISDNKCPSVSNFTTCLALNCPPVILNLTTDETTICLTSSTGVTQLITELSGGDMNADLTYTGPGINQSGVFDPQAAGVGQHELVIEYSILSCSQTDTLVINVLPTPEASFTTQSNICVTDTFIVDFTGSFDVDADFNWDLDGGSISGTAPGPFKVWYDTPGSYSIGLELDEANCLSSPFVEMVTVEDELQMGNPGFGCDFTTGEITFTWPNIDCASEYIVFVNGMEEATITDLTYLVTGLGDDEEVDFEIIAVSDCACGDMTFSTSCTTLACPPLSITIDEISSICLDDNAGNITLNATITGNPSVSSEIWDGPGVTNGVFNPNTAGVGVHPINYSFSIDNCDYSDIMMVEVFDVPTAEVLFEDPSCPGEVDGSLEINASGGDGDYTVLVNNVEITGNVISDLEGNSYNVMVVDGNNCTYSENIVLTAPTDPETSIFGNTFIISKDTNTYTINSNIFISQISNITWFDTLGTVLCNDPSCISIILAPEDDMTICVLIEYGDGCSTEACIDIRAEKIKQVYIPNIFSPNDDGVNDIWIVEPGDEVVFIPLVQVYNRWGEKMYEKEDLEMDGSVSGWDGTFKGSSLNPGVYVYKVLVVYKDGLPETITGDITITR